MPMLDGADDWAAPPVVDGADDWAPANEDQGSGVTAALGGDYGPLHQALEPAPNTTYGTVLPFAKDNTTGALRWAMPDSMRGLLQGGVDLLEGPQTGTVTPQATGVLAGAALGRWGVAGARSFAGALPAEAGGAARPPMPPGPTLPDWMAEAEPAAPPVQDPNLTTEGLFDQPAAPTVGPSAPAAPAEPVPAAGSPGVSNVPPSPLQPESAPQAQPVTTFAPEPAPAASPLDAAIANTPAEQGGGLAGVSADQPPAPPVDAGNPSPTLPPVEPPLTAGGGVPPAAGPPLTAGPRLGAPPAPEAPAPGMPPASVPPTPVPPPPRDAQAKRAELEAILADPRTAAEIAEEGPKQRAAAVADIGSNLPPGFGFSDDGNHVTLTDPRGDVLAVQPFDGVTPSNLAAMVNLATDAHGAGLYDDVYRQGTGTQASPVIVGQASDVHAAGLNVAEPTPGQAAAGNYAKGHIVIGGLPISIENPAGSTRSGVGPDGQPWSVQMPYDYGYIRKTTGADGDHVDVLLGPDAHKAHTLPVFIVDQRNIGTGGFDEHKALIGFPTLAAATMAYQAGFSDGMGPQRMGAVTPMQWGQFKGWLKGPTQAPLQPNEFPPAPLTRQRARKTYRRPLDLVEFLAANGGIADYRGELRSMDAQKKFVPKLGMLVRKTGRPLDYARELAAQAGYIPNPSDIRTLLEAIDENLRGNRVFAAGDLAEMMAEKAGAKADREGARMDELRKEMIDLARIMGVLGLRAEDIEFAATLAMGGMENEEALVDALHASAQRLEDELAAKAQTDAAAFDATLAATAAAGTEWATPWDPTDVQSDAGSQPLDVAAEPSGQPAEPQLHPADAGAATGVQPGEVRPADEAAGSGAERGSGEAGGDRHGAEGGGAAGGDGAVRGERSEPEQAGPGAAAESGRPGLSLADQARAVAKHFEGGAGFATILQARKFISNLIGAPVQPGTMAAKQADEAIELGVVMEGRRIVAALPKAEVFDALVNLYGRQPTLGTRTSDSIERQAYSTPLPLAYAVDRLARMTSSSTVYEPTAGNGALLIGANPQWTFANELDPERADALKAQGFQPTTENATKYLPPLEGVDIVVANPPFGAVAGEDGKTIRHDLRYIQPGYTTNEIDHAIALHALGAMKEGGRAVLVLGGLNKLIATPKARAEAYGASKAKREFFFTLYGKYNVVDHFTVPGDLYSKQGAAWPVDVIVIEGRGKSALPSPVAAAPRIVGSWDALKGVIDAIPAGEVAVPAAPEPAAAGVGAAGQVGSDERPADEPRPAAAGGASGPGLSGPSGNAGSVDAGAGEEAKGGGEAAGGSARPGGRSGGKSGPRAKPGRASAEPSAEQPPASQPDENGKRPASSSPSVAEAGSGASDTGNEPVAVVGERDTGGSPAGRLTPEPTPPTAEPSDLQAVYKPQSKAKSVGTLLPANLRTATSSALSNLAKTVGMTIDKFVAERLGYSEEALAKHFSAEQIDALALGIFNVDQGKSVIVGDQTGVGKGRAQPLDAKILTPTGWQAMGDMRVGSQVVAADGRATTVTGVFPQGEKDIFDVVFSDGAKTQCTSDHLWATMTRNQRHERKVNPDSIYAEYKVRQTDELMRTITRIHSVPLPSAVQFVRQNVPMDPYLLGTILGDGCIRPTSVEIVVAEPEMVECVTAALPKGMVLKKKPQRDYHYSIVKADRNWKGQNRRNNETLAAIRSLGLDKAVAATKHVPDCYLFNETAVRLAMLQGLMDTDGTVGARGACVFYSISAALADAVQFIVRSLGGTASRSIKKTTHHPCHVVFVRLPQSAPPFRLPRKLARVRDWLKYPPARYIKSITPAGRAPAQCISVEDAARLYVTDDLIVTHNTVAGMIRYADRKGLTPVFVTEKPGLYADMVRDLTDIGMPDFWKSIAITNTAENIPLSNGEAIKSSPAEQKALLEGIIAGGKLPAGKRALFTTYSQLQQQGKGDTNRIRAARALMPNAFLILDESHNAGGSEGSESSDDKTLRSDIFRGLVQSAKTVAFSSATWAKRPDVLTLYAQKTDMLQAVEKPGELANAIIQGGVPMQQIVTAALAEVGQYVRREKSFKGISYDAIKTPVDRTAYQGLATQMGAINGFYDDAVKPFMKELTKQIQADGKTTSADGSIGAPSVNSTGFSSVMHNLINQLLLSSKADATIEHAKQEFAKGNVVLMTVANTMGSFIEEYAEERGLKHGDAVDMNFNTLVRRYLDRTLVFSVKKPFAGKGDLATHYRINLEKGTIEKLPGTRGSGGRIDMPDGMEAEIAELRRRHQAIADAIEQLTLKTMPISPLDYIMDSLKRAGMNVGEITGRTYGLEYAADGSATLRVRPGSEKGTAGRRRVIGGFNDGSVDAVLFNQSGATGVSLHASEKNPKAGQKKRVQITVQPEGNIDTQMQMFGRPNRTGQVVLPSYIHLVADVPAEVRPAALLSKKMASLNASTTASRKGALEAADAPDFLNEYGGRVMARILTANEEWADALAGAIPQDGAGSLTAPSEFEELARKVSGHIAIVPSLEMQEAIFQAWDDGYRALMKEMADAGENTLEAPRLDLGAKILESHVVQEAKGKGDNPFTQAVTMSRMDVARTQKPPTPARTVDLIRRGLAKKDEEIQPTERMTVEAAAEAIADLKAQGAKASTRFHERVDQQEEPRRKALQQLLDDGEISAKVYESRLTKLDAGIKKVNGILNEWLPGRIINIAEDAANPQRAMVLSLRPQGENWLAPSAWTASALFDDGTVRSISTTSTLEAATTDPDDDTEAFLQKIHDDGATGREERWIMTGNILGGFAAHRGQIINFTDDAGELRQGVMMKRGFDFEKFAASRALTMAPALAERFLAEGGSKETPPYVTTSDATLRIAQDSAGDYVITAPASKERGGVWFLNGALRRAIGGSFVSAAGKMRAKFTYDQLRAVMDAVKGIMAQQGGVHLTSDHPDAKKFAEGRGARMKVAERQPAPAAAPTIERDPSPEAVQALIDVVRDITGGRVQIEVVNNGAGALEVDAGTGLAHGYQLGRLIRAALTPEIANTLNHEAIHALVTLGVFTRAEWNTLAAAAKNQGWEKKHDIARYQGISAEDSIEEAIAHEFAAWMEKRGEAPKGMVVRIFTKGRTFFQRLGSALRGRGFENADDVFKKIAGGDIGARYPAEPDNPERARASAKKFEPGINDSEPIASFTPAAWHGRQPTFDEVEEDHPDLPMFALPASPAAATGPGASVFSTTLGHVPLLGQRLAAATANWMNPDELLRDMLLKHEQDPTPMARGSKDAMAAAKDLASQLRDFRDQGEQRDAYLQKHFKDHERKAMWDAMDDDYVAVAQGRAPGAVAALPPDLRAPLAQMRLNADAAWKAAQKVGLVDKADDGLDFYTPRMLIDVGTPNARVVRDIRTLNLATMRLWEAVAGRMLVNRVKASSARAGQQVISSAPPPTVRGGAGDPLGGLHGVRTSTPNLRQRKYETTAETEAAAGRVTRIRGADGFWWTTIPHAPALYETKWLANDEHGEPVVHRVPMWVRADFVGPLRAVLRKNASPIYRAYMNVKGRVMSAIMYGVAHTGVIMGRAVLVAPNIVGAIKEGSVAKKDPAIRQRAIRTGNLDPVGKMYAMAQDAEGIANPPQIKPGRSWLMQGATSPLALAGKPGKAVRNAILRGSDALGDAVHNKLVWDVVQSIQFGLFMKFERKALADGFSPTTAARLAGHMANRFAGSLPQESMAPGARRLANVLMFSPSYRGTEFGMIKDLLTGLPRDTLAQIHRDVGPIEAEKAAGWGKSAMWKSITADFVAFVMAMSVAQSAINVAFLSKEKTLGAAVSAELAGYPRRLAQTGADIAHGKTINPVSMLLSVMPTWDNEPGKEMRIKIGYAVDGTAIYMRFPLGKTVEDIADLLTHPIQAIDSMMAPYIHLASAVWNNDGGFGRPLYPPHLDSPAKIGEALWNVAMEAMKDSGPATAEMAVKDMADAAMTGQKSPKGTAFEVGQVIGGGLGFSLSRGYPGGELKGEAAAHRQDVDYELQQAMPKIKKMVLAGDRYGANKLMADMGVQAMQRIGIIKSIIMPSRVTKGTIETIKSMTPEQRARVERDRAAAP